MEWKHTGFGMTWLSKLNQASLLKFDCTTKWSKNTLPLIAKHHANSEYPEIRKLYGAFVGTKSMWCFSWQSSGLAPGPVAALREERDRKCQAMRPHIRHVNHRHRGTETQNCESAEGKSELRGSERGWESGGMKSWQSFLSWALGPYSQLESSGREMEYPLLSRNK